MERELREAKLAALVEIAGFESLVDHGSAALADSVCPGICTNPHCNYTTEVEKDQTGGWCEACGERSVVSALILAELI